MENSEPRWEPYEEYLFRKQWFEILEKEILETGGLGYKKAGIYTENRKRKEKLMGNQSHPEE
jgi:hypothetical protein